MTSVRDFVGVNPSDKLETEKSIFVWLDIVGFADAVDDEKRYEELSELLAKFQSLFNEGDGYNSTIISDGIILQILNPKYQSFIKFLKDIGKKQFKFICDNKYFIRGGIAIGTKFNHKKNENKNNLFISNGLARAVKIEEKHVCWPIIGTNEKNLQEIRTFFAANNEKETFGLTQGLNAKGEVIYFLDFIDDDEKYYLILNDNIKKNKSKPAFLNKYIWLLRYYHHKYNADNLDESLMGMVI